MHLTNYAIQKQTDAPACCEDYCDPAAEVCLFMLHGAYGIS